VDLVGADGAAIGVALVLAQTVSKLIDQKINKPGSRAVKIDLNQGEMAATLGALAETLAATGQTLERINERMDDLADKATRTETVSKNINRVVTEMGGNVYKIQEDMRLKAATAEAREKGRREALAEGGKRDTRKI